MVVVVVRFCEAVESRSADNVHPVWGLRLSPCPRGLPLDTLVFSCVPKPCT